MLPLGARGRRTRVPGSENLIVGLMDRPVRLDGPELVPAGVALDFLLAAGLEQLDQATMLAQSLLEAMRQVDAPIKKPRCCFLVMSSACNIVVGRGIRGGEPFVGVLPQLVP